MREHGAYRFGHGQHGGTILRRGAPTCNRGRRAARYSGSCSSLENVNETLAT
jgi:hypothetical protein